MLVFVVGFAAGDADVLVVRGAHGDCADVQRAGRDEDGVEAEGARDVGQVVGSVAPALQAVFLGRRDVAGVRDRGRQVAH